MSAWSALIRSLLLPQDATDTDPRIFLNGDTGEIDVYKGGVGNLADPQLVIGGPNGDIEFFSQHINARVQTATFDPDGFTVANAVNDLSRIVATANSGDAPNRAKLIVSNADVEIDSGSTIYGAGVGLTQRKIKPANESRILVGATADASLQVVVPPNSTHTVRARVLISAVTTTPDVTVGWSGPAGATMDEWSILWNDTGTTLASLTLANIGTTRNNALDAGGLQEHHFTGSLFVGANGGTFAFRWGPTNADPNGTTVHKGSFLEVSRVS